jgi:putative flippase GtrA
MAILAQSDSGTLSLPRAGARVPPLLVYLIFGGIAALANLMTGWLLYGTGLAPALPYWCATGTGALVGMATAFVLNYWFNFAFRERSALQQFGTFSLVSVGGICLTSALSSGNRAVLELLFGDHVRIAGFGVSTMFAAHLAAVALVVVYSYPTHKAVSFNVGIRRRLLELRSLTVR